MENINRVELIGHLGADPELRHTATNVPVANLRLATTKRFKDREGQPRQKTEWHRIVCWADNAERAAKYLATGSYVRIEGELETSEYTDKEGVKRWVTQVRAFRIGFLDPKDRNGADAPADVALAETGPAPSDAEAPF
jgi:single-strand DNA-binding protein